MREIRFRGKTLSGKWVYGYYLHDGQRGRYVITDGLLDIDAVKPETIGQFTGLHDKNNVKIYEGDIVVRRDLTFNIEKTCVVVYNNEIASFRLHHQNKVYTERYNFINSDTYNDGKCTLECKYEFEVVGNIYDKELINNK